MTTSHTSAQRLSMTVGVVTSIAGGGLLLAPNRAGPFIGLTAKRDAQLIGTLDLALSPGLIFGRPQWPWLSARVVSNLATAAFVLQRSEGDIPLRNARTFSAIMVVATIFDSLTLRTLRRTARF